MILALSDCKTSTPLCDETVGEHKVHHIYTFCFLIPWSDWAHFVIFTSRSEFKYLFMYWCDSSLGNILLGEVKRAINRLD